MDGDWLQKWAWLDFAHYKVVAKPVPMLVVVEGEVSSLEPSPKETVHPPHCETNEEKITVIAPVFDCSLDCKEMELIGCLQKLDWSLNSLQLLSKLVDNTTFMIKIFFCAQGYKSEVLM